MKILITGASGYLGNKLAHTLADQGNEVHALVRSGSAESLCMHPNITVFKGDILDPKSLLVAMKDCTQVYHTAAKVGAWSRNAFDFYKVNVEGTCNVLDSAKLSGVERTLITSSCGVLGPSAGKPLEENDVRTTSFSIDYDLSKKQGEDLALQYARAGMNIVVVSPCKIYGPGNISHSLTANAVIQTFLKKKIAVIPSPGDYRVCFGFIDDIINGYILAMEKGKAGEKYILGGINMTYNEFFEEIRLLSHCGGYIIPLSKTMVKSWARVLEFFHTLTGCTIRYTSKSVDHFFSNYIFSSKKAIDELGYRITPFEEAMQKTIHFLNDKPCQTNTTH